MYSPLYLRASILLYSSCSQSTEKFLKNFIRVSLSSKQINRTHFYICVVHELLVSQFEGYRSLKATRNRLILEKAPKDS
jgi:hypothetical protein